MATKEPIFFIHLTDIHISAPGKKPLFGLDMSDKLRAACTDIRSLETKSSFVVISGDLTHDGDLEDYRFLRKLLDEEEALLGIPIHVALGNHDFREPFREGFLEEEPSNESYYYSFMADGLRIVMLNTQVPGTHGGRLDDVQLAWLKQVLAEPAPSGTIIVHHHPVVKTPTVLMDDHLLENPQDLARVIDGSDVIGLLSGHIHYHNVGTLNGILCAAADGLAFGLDPSASTNMRFIDRSGYNLITVKNGQMSVQPMTLPGEQRLLYELNVSKIHAEA
ncbi:metallophosphoesterase family protein [Paenibacillus qinlingensis]|uniref:metallophosphoesterase family protein n=1 Tax=Paenibacillus qinlingensis TaxID=1837343 RepID=UPI0015658A7D|nr:metallophosphoesterase [Paenibacillus qinlingensis]NQX61806.1 metallophosphoesterase [Paenibacillus qinlingensis]